MAWSILASTSAGSSDTINVTTSAIDTSGADLIVLSVASYIVVSNPLPSDSKGNTWHPARSAFSASLSRVSLYYAYNPTVGTGHTFTCGIPATQNFPSISVVAVSGALLTDPLDQTNGGTASSSTTVSTGNITPTQDNELIVTSVAGQADITTGTPPSGFTIQTSVTFAGGVHWSSGIATQIQTTATTIGATWTLGTGTHCAVIASFTAASAATGNPWYAYAQQ